jgi:hypothetical protein
VALWVKKANLVQVESIGETSEISKLDEKSQEELHQSNSIYFTNKFII